MHKLTLMVWGMQDAIAIRKRLGDRVRKLRKARKWSQEELAHESGLARSFTGAIERGEKDLRLTTLVKLANTFRVPLGELFK
jgi:transcriptional regulator with XRE-family HTH domain